MPSQLVGVGLLPSPVGLSRVVDHERGRRKGRPMCSHRRSNERKDEGITCFRCHHLVQGSRAKYIPVGSIRLTKMKVTTYPMKGTK